MQFRKDKETILIIDFGSQVTKLIGRRIRELGVYSEIIPPKEIKKLQILDLSKELYYLEVHLQLKKNFKPFLVKFFSKKIPILGICYGLQLIAKIFGGKIKSSTKEENLAEH